MVKVFGGEKKRREGDSPSTEPSICETSDVEGETGADDQARRFQHLGHAWETHSDTGDRRRRRRSVIGGGSTKREDQQTAMR